MKNRLLLFAMVFISFSGIQGKDFNLKFNQPKKDTVLLPYRESVHLFSAGYGYGNFIRALFFSTSNYLDLGHGGFGPAHLKYEYGVTKKLGLGFSFNYMNLWANSEHTSYVYSYDQFGNLIYTPVTYKDYIVYTTYSLIPRINFHFATSPNFDPYFGFGFGYRTDRYKVETADPNYAQGKFMWSNLFPIGFEMTLGARYFLADNFAIYSEAGLSKSVIQFGVVGKF